MERLSDANLVGNDPDINLTEAFLENWFVTEEEFGVFRRILYIYDQTHVTFLKALALMEPNTPQIFWMESDAAKPSANLLKNYINLPGFDLQPIIVPGGQDYFVASERHRPDSEIRARYKESSAMQATAARPQAQ
jgi:hypothetical protein